jgi:SPP1 gp7 family putative phage head morphogenesis protein
VTDDILRTFSNFRVLFANAHPISERERRLAEVAATERGSTSAQFAAQMKAAIGVEMITPSSGLAALIPGWVEHNLGLITALDDGQVFQLTDIVRRGVASGIRVESVRDEIMHALGVGKSKAALLARDQTLKLHGQMTQERQQSAGLDRYTWSTSKDERVRARHRQLDGTVQRWDDPPIVDMRSGRRAHPGGDFQCRCVAIPYVEGLLEELEGFSPPAAQKPEKRQVMRRAPAAAAQQRIVQTTGKALQGAGGGTKAQAEAREAIDTILRKQGIVPVRDPLPGQGSMVFGKLPEQHVAIQDPVTGQIVISEKHRARFERATKALASGQKLTQEDSSYLSMVLHESTHAASPSTPLLYNDRAVRFLEETTTELTANEIAKSLTGVAPHGSYKTWIDRLESVTGSHESAVNTALRFRRVQELHASPGGYVFEFIGSMDNDVGRALRKTMDEAGAAFDAANKSRPVTAAYRQERAGARFRAAREANVPGAMDLLRQIDQASEGL